MVALDLMSLMETWGNGDMGEWETHRNNRPLGHSVRDKL